tara:strand:+ start:153 stop:461 length:309 start_codon:yes stop_codon:yes gene_type:complete
MPQYFDSTAAKPMKTKRSVYRGGGAVKNNRGMGVALKSGGRIKAKDGNWIQKAIKKPGSLRASLGVKKGNKIPAKKLNAAAKKGGKLGQRARLAQTLKGFKK